MVIASLRLITILAILAPTSFVHADDSDDEMLAKLQKMRSEAAHAQAAATRRSTSPPPTVGNARRREAVDFNRRRATSDSASSQDYANQGYGTESAPQADWQDQQQPESEAYSVSTPKPQFLSNTNPKNRAIVTGVVAGGAVAAVAGGIAIAIEESKIKKAQEEGRPIKPLFGLGLPGSRGGLLGGGRRRRRRRKATSQGSTSLTRWVQAGEMRLPVTGQSGFTVGDSVVLDLDTPREEVNKIVGFGSLLLEQPLKFAHTTGAVVAVIENKEVPVLLAKEAASQTIATTTTPVAVAAAGDEIPLPVWIALGVLVCCCCAAILAAVISSFVNPSSKGKKKRAAKGKGLAAEESRARSDSVATHETNEDSYYYNDESYYSDQSGSYGVVAPQDGYYDTSGYNMVYQEPMADYTRSVPIVYTGYSPTVQGVTVRPYSGFRYGG